MPKTQKLFFENSRRKLSELVGADWNPRTLTKKQADDLKKSLEKFDLAEVPVINLDGMIIAGHQRTKILSQLYGDIEIDVRVPSRLMTDDEVKEYNVRSNKNTGQWDYDLLANNFELEDLIDWGFTEEELSLDLEPEVMEGNTDEDEVPEAPERPITVAGDVWLLGNHRLMCGDSTSIDAVEKLMDGKKADMVFTDPPYNIASDSSNFAKDVSKSMKQLSEAEWDKGFQIEEPLRNIIVACKENVTIYVWTSHFLIQRIWDELGKTCDYTSYLVWSKPNPMPSLSKRHPTWNTELCVYASRGSQRVVNFPKEGHFLSCREVVKKSDGTHPTQKPVELIEPIIEFSSDPENLVLDLFLGSGSTLIACEKTNRICYGMELAAAYCDVIINRWQNFTGKQATHAETGLTFNEHKAGLPANSI